MRVQLTKEAREYLKSLDKKSKNICKKNLQKLATPHPGRGAGDKEKLAGEEDLYRLHIGRTHTAFYTIHDETVIVLEIMTIQAAHKKYGKL